MLGRGQYQVVRSSNLSGEARNPNWCEINNCINSKKILHEPKKFMSVGWIRSGVQKFVIFTVVQCFPKCGPQTSSVSIIEDLLQIQTPRPHPRIGNSGPGGRLSCLLTSPWGDWRTAKCEATAQDKCGYWWSTQHAETWCFAGDNSSDKERKDIYGWWEQWKPRRLTERYAPNHALLLRATWWAVHIITQCVFSVQVPPHKCHSLFLCHVIRVICMYSVEKSADRQAESNPNTPQPTRAKGPDFHLLHPWSRMTKPGMWTAEQICWHGWEENHFNSDREILKSQRNVYLTWGSSESILLSKRYKFPSVLIKQRINHLVENFWVILISKLVSND